MHPIAQLDHQFVWHPFTQMQDWLEQEPIVIVSGDGARLRDIHGKEYLDANSSIWTNLHGHNHPVLNAAISTQLGKIAHSSALGFANEPASILASKLVEAGNRPELAEQEPFTKVFFSDNGSTAIETALKLSHQYNQRVKNRKEPRFLAMEGGYHGDTIGAVSVGQIDLFHGAYRGLLFGTDKVMAPYCYRCPFNRATPERRDAREYRQCGWECVGLVKETLLEQRKREPYAAMVVEPLMHGAAGMIPQPPTWLAQVHALLQEEGTQLIADEVMTGFGRTGMRDHGSLFASHHEGVQPDFLALAKGLTGGYLPMAATLCRQDTFDAFLGPYEEFKTFFHGHSYTANQLGSAAALASLGLLQAADFKAHYARLEDRLRKGLEDLWTLPAVGDIRQEGLVAGIELVRDWERRTPFALTERIGMQICEIMATQGVLTRAIGNVIVLMPPYVTTELELDQMVRALSIAIAEVSHSALKS